MTRSILALLLASASPVLAQDFPQTFEHRFGTTVVEARPERVVSLDYGGQDDLLALGVGPVGVRYWYGDYRLGTWPWAEAALGASTFELFEGDINVEQVAALDPDVILAVYSGITEEEYALLSQIAPVIATEARYPEYGTPWHVRVRTVARAVGKSAEAEAAVAAIEGRIADIRAAHPDWEGRTAVLAYWYQDAPGAYASTDPRSELLEQMGFVVPEAIDAAADAGSFYATLSAEDLSPLDVDLLIWADDAGSLAPALDTPLRRSLRAHAEGREVYAGDLLFGALTFNSLLSLPYALDQLVPQIELAVDGDPATPVPEAVAAGLTE